MILKTGTVLWFNDVKGFGFIRPDDKGADLFVHHTDINMQGFRSLQEGQRVQFEAVSRPQRGEVAKNVILCTLSSLEIESFSVEKNKSNEPVNLFLIFWSLLLGLPMLFFIGCFVVFFLIVISSFIKLFS